MRILSIFFFLTVFILSLFPHPCTINSCRLVSFGCVLDHAIVEVVETRTDAGRGQGAGTEALAVPEIDQGLAIAVIKTRTVPRTVIAVIVAAAAVTAGTDARTSE